MKMIIKQNPLTGDYLCCIDTIGKQAYYVKGKKHAEKFVEKINNEIKSGRLTEKMLMA